VSTEVRTDWLGTPKAAEYLGISVRTLYRLMDEGRIPAYEMGRVYRLKRADLDAFLESARVRPGTLAHLHTPPRRTLAPHPD
jgi:excisionase family DNA binding protein